ncbi:sensor histidine kinase [Sphingobium sp. SCG-1]|uniref:sensor histidine kinase n=1 Tax=Sphingobium sp. SCG-1 TaxID=2072936 RepID=UPI00167104E8|nr:PAS domain-containing protein [Sphingobium sp. SCG-1]
MQHLTEVLLNSRVPGFILCGPQRIVIYNGAFAQLLDARHPNAFGKPFAEAFPESEEASYQFDEAFDGKPGIVRNFLWPTADHTIRPPHIFDLELTPVTDDKLRVSWVQVRVTSLRTDPAQFATDREREAAEIADPPLKLTRILEQSEERLRLALDVAGLAIWDWNVKTGKVIWSDEHYRMAGYEVGEVEPGLEKWADRVHPEDRLSALAKLNEARESGVPYIHELRFQHPNGRIVWASAFGRFFFDAVGEAERMIGAMYDITEQRSVTQRQQLVLSELQHRSRNLIGLIDSIARKTLMRSASMEDFAIDLGHRLSALARVQAFTAQIERGGGVTFRELLLSELSAHGALLDEDEFAEKVTLEGEADVYLSPDMVQTFALALHELATNATKYGALKDQGHLLVRWDVQDTDREGETLLSVEWLESGVDTAYDASSTSGGYGRELIERALPYELGATTSYEIDAGVVRCTIALPMLSVGKGSPTSAA